MTRLKAPKDGCTIRMYRHGLGDCFLLAFANAGGHQKYVLVDCGVLVGSPNAKKEIRKVATNVKEATGGRLHAAVVTHEHWDHVSGFVQAQDILKDLRVDELWIAWTEDMSNPLAKELKERGKIALQAITMALFGFDPVRSPDPERIRDRVSSDLGASAYSDRAIGLTEFHGDFLGAVGGGTTQDGMKWAATTWKPHRYLTPGMKPPKIRGLPDVRFFVLGPPQDKNYLKRSRPRKSEHEVYLHDPSRDELFGFLNRLQVDGGTSSLRALGHDEKEDPTRPFNTAYERDPGRAEVAESVRRYDDPKEDWRQVDDDWIQAAGELALKLDRHTNNTSLALAIELSPGGKVLIFPGDAQVGNWLSWQDVKWTEKDDSVIDAADLLSRTVVYKVGHHGSHNATLSDKGLELMTGPDLIGLIPVNTQTAQKKRWSMPYPPLRARLEELSEDRTYLADAGVDGLQNGGEEQLPNAVIRQEALYLDVELKQ